MRKSYLPINTSHPVKPRCTLGSIIIIEDGMDKLMLLTRQASMMNVYSWLSMRRQIQKLVLFVLLLLLTACATSSQRLLTTTAATSNSGVETTVPPNQEDADIDVYKTISQKDRPRHD